MQRSPSSTLTLLLFYYRYVTKVNPYGCHHGQFLSEEPELSSSVHFQPFSSPQAASFASQHVRVVSFQLAPEIPPLAWRFSPAEVSHYQPLPWSAHPFGFSVPGVRIHSPLPELRFVLAAFAVAKKNNFNLSATIQLRPLPMVLIIMLESVSNFWVCGWNPMVWPFK